MAKPSKRDLKNEKRAADPKVQEAKRIQKLTTYTGAAVIGLLILIVSLNAILSPRSTSANELPESVDLKLAEQPSLGNPDAPVKVVEFADFQCSHCKDFHEQSFTPLKTEFMETNKVEFFYINFPVIEGSRNVAHAAECMGQQGEELFWSFHDALFDHQTEITALPLSLIQIAQSANIEFNEEDFRTCISLPASPAVEDDINIGKAARVVATPTIFVNRKSVSAAGYAALKQAIEAELAKQ